MGGRAQWDQVAEESMYQATGTESAGGLRQIGVGVLQREAAERQAAHRSRRAAEQAVSAALAETARTSELGGLGEFARSGGRSAARSGALRVRQAVAARYERSVSYREFLAAEADRALQQAQAEAEVAARKAKAVAAAQMQLMEELEQWNRPAPGASAAAIVEQQTETRAELAHALADIALGARELIGGSEKEKSIGDPKKENLIAQEPHEPKEARERQSSLAKREGSADRAGTSRVAEMEAATEVAREVSLGGLRVRLFEDFGATHPAVAELRTGTPAAAAEGEDELEELEQEIEFRAAPEFEPLVLEAQAIPGNLIEFPRQLVASRKARPRLAEGPLRADAPAEPQLRIFEVEPEAIAKGPATAQTAAAPDWQSLLLDYARTPAPTPNDAQQAFTVQPQTAPLALRLMAATVDFLCVGTAFAGFVAVVLEVAGKGARALPLPLLGASAASVLLALFVGYQVLFFSLAGATPGMRCARIGLCTFGDRNPSRKAMRRRVLATLLAACPLGLGLAWACMDEERLGWHDRMSRMYQRAY